MRPAENAPLSVRGLSSIAWCVVLSSALFACGDSASTGAATSASAAPLGLTPEQASRVLARVGDETITLGDYAAVLERMDPFDRLRYQTREKRRELLKEMVELELLAIEAKRRGLDQRPEAQEATRQVLREALLSEARRALPAPAEIGIDEVRAYYEQHRADYREPERRRVSAIVLDDEARAKAALEEALAASDPTSWGKLVSERSVLAVAKDDKSSKLPLDLAGDLGIVGPPDDPKGANAKVPAPVRAAAFAVAEVGSVHREVVAHEGRFYVVRLAGKTAAHERSVEEADRQIRVELLKQKQAELEKKLEAELRAKFKIEVDESELAKVGTASIGVGTTEPATAGASASAGVPSTPPSSAPR